MPRMIQTKIGQWAGGKLSKAKKVWVKTSKAFRRHKHSRSATKVRSSKPFRIKGYWRKPPS